MTLHVPNAQVSEGFAEMQALHADREMKVEPTTWGSLGYGMYILDTNRKCWLVIGQIGGWVRLMDMNGTEVSVPPRDPNHRIDAVVLPEAEAILLLEKTLGAKVIGDNYTVARQLMVADRWAVEMMPTTGGPKSPAMRKLRDHMSWFHHNQYTGDIKTVEELARAHEELHASIGSEPMSRAHHHRPNAKGTAA